MKIEEIQKRIGAIDLELLGLIEERLSLGLRSERYPLTKEESRGETEIAQRVKMLGLNLVAPDFSEQLLQTIIDEGLRLQSERRQLVAFQGEHGAYSEIAARRMVAGAAYVPCMEFTDVFNGVADGYLDLGVVPVENSLEGAVTQVNDLLTTTDLKVIGEIKVKINHCLLTTPEADYREIRVVYSHPQALAQCRGFLSRNKLEPRPFYDTAGSAKMLSREHPRAAAVIASKLCAELYGLQVLKEGIDDGPSNSTRFLQMSREGREGIEGNKCSIIFATSHESGRLHRILKLFADASLNLTRIASMPLRTDPGNYTFFCDFEGSIQDPLVQGVLSQLQEQTISYRFLGCYPSDRS
jgi:prephenate dehydratase/chorismate mutase